MINKTPTVTHELDKILSAITGFQFYTDNYYIDRINFTHIKTSTCLQGFWSEDWAQVQYHINADNTITITHIQEYYRGNLGDAYNCNVTLPSYLLVRSKDETT